MNNEIRSILEEVESGNLSVDDALLRIKMQPFDDIGFAKVDTHRKIRQGHGEVIYGAGKTSEQITGIISSMLKNGQSRILITRLGRESADVLSEKCRNDFGVRFNYYEDAGIGTVNQVNEKTGIGSVLVITGGTSDIPVAEEAARTAEFFGNDVVRVYDVGVAGIHRLLAHMETIMSASVIIAIAGMEGALASVVGGLAECPVIAVPTSVGYGASFEGLSALLSMLNSCANGICTVNIDNGFGAGYLADMINHMERKM